MVQEYEKNCESVDLLRIQNQIFEKMQDPCCVKRLVTRVYVRRKQFSRRTCFSVSDFNGIWFLHRFFL